jgi:hypothetical protein
MSTFTLVTVEHHPQERYEALYANGQKIAEPDGGGAFTASGILEAIASHDIGIAPAYVNVDPKYDEEVIAVSGWPKHLDEIPESARVS